MGPFLQYTTEKPADPIELRIYPGADGTFTLYEDETITYNYEKGIFATIDFKWNDTERVLTIEERKGDFPGMIENRVFNIIIVSQNHGNDLGITELVDKSINYDGEK